MFKHLTKRTNVEKRAQIDNRIKNLREKGELFRQPVSQLQSQLRQVAI